MIADVAAALPSPPRRRSSPETPVLGIFGNGSNERRWKIDLFSGSNNSGLPEMWLIDGRELVRPSESRGYLSIDPRPREASTAFRVIRGRWEQIRVLAFLRFRVSECASLPGHRTVCSVEGKVRFVFVNVTWPCGDLEVFIEAVCTLPYGVVLR